MSPPGRLVRVLPASELHHTGRAAETGLQLTVAWEHVQGLSCEVIAGAFGYTVGCLDDLIARGDELVMVIAEAAPDAGYATSAALAGLMRDLRPEEGHFSDATVAAALDTPAEAEDLHVSQAQAALGRVFGIRPPLFGQPRFASPQWPQRRLLAPFFLDEKVDLAALRGSNNPLRPGTALTLEAYPSMPIVQRLLWPATQG